MNVTRSIFRQYDIRGLVGHGAHPRARARPGTGVRHRRVGPVRPGTHDRGRAGQPAVRRGAGGRRPPGPRRRRRHCGRRRGAADPRTLLRGRRARGRRRNPGHRLAQSARVQWLQAGPRRRVVPRRGASRSCGRSSSPSAGAAAPVARRATAACSSRYREGILSPAPARAADHGGRATAATVRGAWWRSPRSPRTRRRGHAALLRVGRHLPEPPPRSHGARESPGPPGRGPADRRGDRHCVRR